ncbi:MAG TPA: hypothetical protein VFJ29_00740 [Candidatus Kapabacteria bacterium]|nr:hypothetical protein [Candidatus Kapabacteria bacterium]
MSGSGAGKVYFVLYLAVVLELLIIIVDRDDAENGLRKQTREIQQIVQQILASLQTSGAQITTTPRDEIVIDPTARNKANEEKNYVVSVNVGDTTAVHGVTGFEINKLMYTLSYQKDTSEAARKDTGNLENIMAVAFQGKDAESPVNIAEDSITYPNTKDYEKHKQSFSIHFKPDQPGMYRFRFNANTNQIIGVDLDPNNYRDIQDQNRLNQVVRIGSVPLTVKQLLAVYKTLTAADNAPPGTAAPKNTGVDDSTRVKLKNFIGKLLFGGASTLESNNGEIMFDVGVRRLEVPPSAKLDVSPQVRRFTAFTGIAIPNLIKANVKQIKFDPPQYGEFYMTGDSTWYWHWTPSLADAGKTITLAYSAHANRGAGPLDNATDTFQITVAKLDPVEKAWFRPAYYFVSNEIPVGDTVTVSRRYKDLEGLYHYELKVGGKVISEVTGQDLHFALDDKYLGQVAELVTAFKTKEMTDFVRTDSVKMPIGPRAIFPNIPNTTIQAGQPLSMDIYQGISPQVALPAGTVVKIVDDEGGKFFNREMSISGTNIVIPMNGGANVSTPTPVNITITSNIPNQLPDKETLVITPRPRKR